VPRVLHVGRAGRLGVLGIRVLDRAVARVPAADAGGLHAPRRRQVRGPEAHALDTWGRRRRSPRGLATPCEGLEDRVDQDRRVDARRAPRAGRAGGRRSGLFPRRPPTLGTMITLSLSPDLLHQLRDVSSSMTHGDSRLLMRVHSCVSRAPSPCLTQDQAASRRHPCDRPARRPSRLPSRMSTVGAIWR